MKIIHISTEDEWKAYHRIVKESIFDRRNFVYDPHHPTVLNPNYRRFLFVKDEEYIGVLVIEFIEDNDAILRIIAIDEPYRNNGLGSILMEICEEWLVEHGKHNVFLHANTRAINFYTRLGYSEMVFPNGDLSIFPDTLDMGKIIK